LVCLHPNTMGKLEQEIGMLDTYLRGIPAEVGKVFIGPNRDEGHDKIIYSMISWSKVLPNAVYSKEVSRPVFLSLMRHCHEMVGNSSAMLYEAPTFGTKTVMIGDRQHGRSPIKGDGKAAERIAKVICAVKDPQLLLRKKFVDLDYGRTAN
jgi:hypothetical protein